MNVLIMEDDAIQLNALKKIVSEYNADWIIFTALNFAEATSLYTEIDIDLFFLDIILDNVSTETGLSLAKNIRRLPNYKSTPIIFITGYREHLLKAVNLVHCFSYITKPYNYSDVYNAINDVAHDCFHENDNLVIRDERCIYYGIKLDSIIYIETSMHQAIIHTINGNFKHPNYSLEKLLASLDIRFIRIHKKYVINTDYIDNYDKSNRLVMLRKPTPDKSIWNDSLSNNPSLPIGRSYKKEFEYKFLN